MYRLAFCQATAPLCPDMQREVWRWVTVLKEREVEEQKLCIQELKRKLRILRKQKRVLEIEVDTTPIYSLNWT
jgi:hypothetical protein